LIFNKYLLLILFSSASVFYSQTPVESPLSSPLFYSGLSYSDIFRNTDEYSIISISNYSFFFNSDVYTKIGTISFTQKHEEFTGSYFDKFEDFSLRLVSPVTSFDVKLLSEYMNYQLNAEVSIEKFFDKYMLLYDIELNYKLDSDYFYSLGFNFFRHTTPLGMDIYYNNESILKISDFFNKSGFKSKLIFKPAKFNELRITHALIIPTPSIERDKFSVINYHYSTEWEIIYTLKSLIQVLELKYSRFSGRQRIYFSNYTIPFFYFLTDDLLVTRASISYKKENLFGINFETGLDISNFSLSGVGELETFPFAPIFASVLVNRFYVKGNLKFDVYNYSVSSEFNWGLVSFNTEFNFYHVQPRYKMEYWQPEYLVFGKKNYKTLTSEISKFGLLEAGFGFKYNFSKNGLISARVSQFIPVYIIDTGLESTGTGTTTSPGYDGFNSTAGGFFLDFNLSFYL